MLLPRAQGRALPQGALPFFLGGLGGGVRKGGAGGQAVRAALGRQRSSAPQHTQRRQEVRVCADVCARTSVNICMCDRLSLHEVTHSVVF